MHQRAVGRDAIQPGRELGLAAELGNLAVHLQKRVLQDFLGVGGIARQAKRQAVHLVLVARDQLIEGRVVTRAQACDELLVGRSFDGGGRVGHVGSFPIPGCTRKHHLKASMRAGRFPWQGSRLYHFRCATGAFANSFQEFGR